MDVYPFDPTFRLVDTLILASLSRNPSHGYSLEAHVVNLSGGRVRPGGGSVYKALARLTKEGLVAQLPPAPDERRRYYDITNEGRAQLSRDLRLLRSIIRAFDADMI